MCVLFISGYLGKIHLTSLQNLECYPVGTMVFSCTYLFPLILWVDPFPFSFSDIYNIYLRFVWLLTTEISCAVVGITPEFKGNGPYLASCEIVLARDIWSFLNKYFTFRNLIFKSVNSWTFSTNYKHILAWDSDKSRLLLSQCPIVGPNISLLWTVKKECKLCDCGRSVLPLALWYQQV